MVQLTRNALEVIYQRPYIQHGETPDDMFRRVARHVAGAETVPNRVDKWEDKFYNLMSSLRFLPNTPTLAHAGVPNSTHCLSACFVDSPTDTLESIIKVGAQMALIEASGGGVGFGLSRLRPAGDKVGPHEDGACGPVRTLNWYSVGGSTFTQGAIRQGAHMAQLHCTHPDIMEFIHCKDKCLKPTDTLSNFNISVQITDEFMDTLSKGAMGEFVSLINPRNGDVVRTVDAKEIWDAICQSAWATGDPGVVFMDRVHEDAPNANLGPIQSSNPCGEEFLEDGSSCNLGSLNLSLYATLDRLVPTGDTVINYALLEDDIYTAVRFLDNVIDVNQFPVARFSEMNQLTRRIGLGVMGWADLLVRMGIKYDSNTALDLAKTLSQFITITAWDASAALAKEKGAFPNWPESSLRRNSDVIAEYGYRNSSVTCIAPTGSISIIAGCSSGIEPHYALMWERKAIWHSDGENRSTFIECPAPLWEMLPEGPYYLMSPGEIESQIGKEKLNLFRTAHQISPENHVRMQAAWQSGITNSISKTINLPESATVKDISDAFKLAHNLGCKAVTVYRDNSKGTQILSSLSSVEEVGRRPNPKPELKTFEIHNTGDVPIELSDLPVFKSWTAPVMPVIPVMPVRTWDQWNPNYEPADHISKSQSQQTHTHTHSKPQPRPRSLPGHTIHSNTGHGSWFFTVNTSLNDGQPVEVFLTPAENNPCVRAGATAVGRLISMALRSDVDSSVIIEQLRGIDCGHSAWVDGRLVTSVYDALSYAIAGELGNEEGSVDVDEEEITPKAAKTILDSYFDGTSNLGAICPKCSQKVMTKRGGCDVCLACGFTSCE